MKWLVCISLIFLCNSVEAQDSIQYKHFHSVNDEPFRYYEGVIDSLGGTLFEAEYWYEDGAKHLEEVTVQYFNSEGKLKRKYVGNWRMRDVMQVSEVIVSELNVRRTFVSNFWVKEFDLSGELLTPAKILLDAYQMSDFNAIISTEANSHLMYEEVQLDSLGRDKVVVTFYDTRDTSSKTNYTYFPDYSVSERLSYSRNIPHWKNVSKYDKEGREVEFIQFMSGLDTSYHAVYTYDDNGNMILEEAGDYRVEYKYVKEVSRDVWSRVEEVHYEAGSIKRQIRSKYDLHGNCTEKITEFTYDDRREEEIWIYSY